MRSVTWQRKWHSRADLATTSEEKMQESITMESGEERMERKQGEMVLKAEEDVEGEEYPYTVDSRGCRTV